MGPLTFAGLCLALSYPTLPDPEPDSRGKGYIGVQLQELEQVQVSRVMPNTPAERAGLRTGDVITRIGDVQPMNMQELIREIGYYRPGSIIRLEIRRGDEVLKVKLKVTRRPDDAGPLPSTNPELP